MSPSSTLVPATTTWQIDPTHSHVEFSVRHLMISTVKGRFTDVQGSANLGDTSETVPGVAVTIQTASIDTRSEQRDGHLRSADFFDVERYPTITFQSSRVEGTPLDGDFRVIGDLTIHGVTREVTLKATSEGRGKDPWGGERAGFSASTKINRGDFGLTWNQALEAGGVVVSDEVKVSLEIELVAQK
ncbi:MAG: YceI family protein [Anaerolineae bacterium]|nr:YceI family protein [Gemmatimonadaceae bacterium]